jgi:hypothetical protein
MSDAHSESALQRIPADIRAALAPSQIARLADLLTPPGQGHSLAYQVSTSFLGREFYVALFSGWEQRSPNRLEGDGQRRSFKEVALGAVLISCLISGLFLLGVIALVAGLYLVKSILGINMLEQHSFLHRFFFD